MLTPFFLSLLFLTTIISLVIYQRTNNEIHLVLSVFTAVIFLIWSFAIAHWFIHILALSALLLIKNPLLNLKPVKINND